MFPSPQGGSETGLRSCSNLTAGGFPSPQGGSETDHPEVFWVRQILVSIPSRRVGDPPPTLLATNSPPFPSPQGGSETTIININTQARRLFPSPQGGSET